ncbi:MAG: glycosyl hydrolase family 18 protein, partial [Defluviitaleaceae bacterium]|nr:glycosyl hydrolase family 18 protein [Defluviitaleaceae bacterium]
FHHADHIIYEVIEIIPEIEEEDVAATRTVGIGTRTMPQSAANAEEETEEPQEPWAALRFQPDIQSPIQARLQIGERVDFFDVGGEDFLLVRNSDGLLGYVLEAELEFIDIIPGRPQEPELRRPMTREYDRPLNVLWQLFTNRVAAADPEQMIVRRGVDVMSPTWFSFDENRMNGDIIDIGNRAYVQWAHANGMEVWALITDNFNPTVSSAVLTSAPVREHVINQLMHFVELYNLDGINIDYEEVPQTDGEYYIQFLRELAVPMRQAGVVLSVAMYVPTPRTMHYNRTEIGFTADFLMIMAYDEHWGTSPIAGPVASYGFVRDGIRNTLLEIPSYRVILGLPFYERIWREEPQGEGEPPRVTSRAVGMNVSRNIFAQQGAVFEWDDDIRKYYGEYFAVENGEEVRFRVWLEDLRSMRSKLELFEQYELAGVAGWRAGLEHHTVWDLIYEFLR